MSTSHHFATPDNSLTRTLLLCSVISGNQTISDDQPIEAPEFGRSLSGTYDSLVDDYEDPKEFRVFTDFAAIPEYIVKLRFKRS